MSFVHVKYYQLKRKTGTGGWSGMIFGLRGLWGPIRLWLYIITLHTLDIAAVAG